MQVLVLRHKPLIAIVSGILIVTGLVSRFILHFGQAYVGAFVAASVLGALPVLVQAIQALRVKVISIDVLVSIAVFGAFLIGSYDESAIVTFLFLLGEQIERYTLSQTRSAIGMLTELAPRFAAVRRDNGTLSEVSVDEVRIGDVVQVATGDRIPVDGTVVSGSGLVNESAITGEPVPVDKTEGSFASAGTLLDDGALSIRTDKVGEDTTFGRIIELVENARDSKSKEERFIDRFSTYYTPVVLVAAVIVGVMTQSINLAITILVLGCPGALVIGVPVSNMAGIGNGARHGVLIKGSEVTQNLSAADTFVFDKTGTLTIGTPEVVSVRTYRSSPDETATAERYLVGAESQSQHPLATAIMRYYGGVFALDVHDVSVIRGGGINAVCDGHNIRVGSPRFLESGGDELDGEVMDDVAALEAEGDSLVALAVDGSVRLMLGIRDRVRPGVADDLTRLRRLGARNLVLLSGDNQKAVDLVAGSLGLDHAVGGMLPDEKAAFISSLQRQGHRVVFVGDGINDSPSIALADVGIAMGKGADVAIDTSDVVLTDSDLSRLPHAYGLAKRTVGNMRENIVIAVGTVVLLLSGLVLTSWLDMAVGMLVHEVSVLVVILNGMRLLRYKASNGHGIRGGRKIGRLDVHQGLPSPSSIV